MPKSCLAVITARGGSKGILNKNLALLAGRPLISYAFEAAKESRHLERIILSSDNENIIAQARKEGIDVPFMRPAELADDRASHVDVLLHAIDFLQTHANDIPEWLVLLQPTSPLRRASDIDAAIELATEHQAESVVSVTEASAHPYLAKTVGVDGRLNPFFADIPNISRRQDFPPCYVPNGAVYVLNVAAFEAQRTLYMEKTFAYIMPPERSVDIDTLFDMCVAAALMDGEKL